MVSIHLAEVAERGDCLHLAFIGCRVIFYSSHVPIVDQVVHIHYSSLSGASISSHNSHAQPTMKKKKSHHEGVIWPAHQK